MHDADAMSLTIEKSACMNAESVCYPPALYWCIMKINEYRSSCCPVAVTCAVKVKDDASLIVTHGSGL